MQSAVDEDQFLRAGAARIVQLLRHPGGTDFVGRAVDDECRNGEIADDFERVEEPAADEMKRHAREGDAGDVGQIGEGRLQDQTVERMPADDLGRDRAAEGVAVEDGRKIARAN